MCGIGLICVAGGLFLAGWTMNGTLLIGGVFILAIGEILIIPRISEYFSSIAPKEERSQYLGYANLAWLLGLSGGGLVGGYLYQVLGEKSSFAIKYLESNFDLAGVGHSEAIMLLCDKTGLSEVDVIHLLWNTYSPWHFWIPFLAVGLLCAIGLFIFSRQGS